MKPREESLSLDLCLPEVVNVVDQTTTTKKPNKSPPVMTVDVLPSVLMAKERGLIPSMEEDDECMMTNPTLMSDEMSQQSYSIDKSMRSLNNNNNNTQPKKKGIIIVEEENEEDVERKQQKDAFMLSDITTTTTTTLPSRSSRRSSILKPADIEIPVSEKRGIWKTLPKPDMGVIRSKSAPVSVRSNKQHHHDHSDNVSEPLPCRRNVTFAEVAIRNYEQTIGDNPSVSYGPPITLDWEYEELLPVTLDDYEANRGPRRGLRQLMLNYYHRKNILMWKFGATEEELKEAEKQVNKIKRDRAMTKALLPCGMVMDMFESASRKSKRLGGGGRKKK